MRASTLAIAGAALFAACTGAFPAKHAVAQQVSPSAVISSAVWADFQAYHLLVGPAGTGFYAVTENGAGGRGIGCKSGRCTTQAIRAEAIKNCEAINPGSTCVIFAVGQDIILPYDIVELAVPQAETPAMGTVVGDPPSPPPIAAPQ